MKKVIFLINSLKIGGAEKVVVLLNEYLSNYFSSKILVLENNIFYKTKNYVHFLYKYNKFNTGLLDLLIGAYKIKKCVKENNIDVVQSHLLKSNYINILSKLIGSKHEVQIVNHSLLDRFHKTIKGRVHLFLMKLLYKHADVSISVSNSVEKELMKYIELPSKRYIINNPIELTSIKTLMKEDVLDFNFNSDIKYLIMVGRINNIKKINLVIDVLNTIQEENLDLILIGEEEDVNINDLKKISKFPKRIHFLGPKTNPYKYLHRSDILIVSSESESFGNVIIESMACGTVVISSDCGGPREILCPNSHIFTNLKKGEIKLCKYGILFGVNDKIGLKRAILKLLKDKALYNYYKKNGIENAKKFDVNIIMQQYKRILNENSN